MSTVNSGNGKEKVQVVRNNPDGLMIAAKEFTSGLSPKQKGLLKKSFEDLTPQELYEQIVRFKDASKRLTPNEKAKFANQLTQDMNDIGSPENKGILAKAFLNLPVAILGAVYKFLNALHNTVVHIESMVDEVSSYTNSTDYNNYKGVMSGAVDAHSGGSIKRGADTISTSVMGALNFAKDVLIGGERPGKDGGSDAMVPHQGLFGVALAMHATGKAWKGRGVNVPTKLAEPEAQPVRGFSFTRRLLADEAKRQQDAPGQQTGRTFDV